jgi:hypothetical protein
MSFCNESALPISFSGQNCLLFAEKYTLVLSRSIIGRRLGKWVFGRFGADRQIPSRADWLRERGSHQRLNLHHRLEASG